MRKLGPQADVPSLCCVFDTCGDFKARSLLCLSLWLWPPQHTLLHRQECGCFLLPRILFCYCFLLRPFARKSPWKPRHQLPWSLGGEHALGIRRRKPTSFLCWSKFGGTGLKELNLSLISSIKPPAKPPEMQSVNKGRMWLYVNVLTPSCEMMSYRQLASDLLPTQRNSRVR